MSQFDFLGYPNEFYVASAAIVGASTGLLTIRTIYYLKRHDAEHKHDEAGKLGLRVMRVYGLIALVRSLGLGSTGASCGSNLQTLSPGCSLCRWYS